MSSFEEQVLNGTYGGKKKKKETSFVDQVIGGSYTAPVQKETNLVSTMNTAVGTAQKLAPTTVPTKTKELKNVNEALPLLNKTVKSPTPDITANYGTVKKNKAKEQKRISDITKNETKMADLQQKLNTSVYSPEKKKEWQTEYNNLKTKTDKLKETSNVNLVGTALNALIETGKGVVDFSEGLMDSYLQFSTSQANPYYWFNPGQLKEHQNLAKEIIKRDASQEWIDNTLGYNKKMSNGKTIQENIDKQSLITSKNLGGQIFRGVGRQLPGLMTGNEATSLTLMGIDSYGSGVEEAYQNGANRTQANIYGGLNAGIEVGTEKMFAGVGGVLGKSPLDDAVKNTVTNRIKGKVGKQAADLAFDMLGEGIEEAAGDVLNPIAKKVTYAKDKKLSDLYKEQDIGKDFITGALSAGLMKGMTLPAQISVRNQNNTQVQNENIAPVVNTEVNEENLPKLPPKLSTQINTQIEELNENNTINQEEVKTPQNRALNEQIAPVKTTTTPTATTTTETTTQNEENLVERLKEMRAEVTNKTEQAKLDAHIEQLEKEIKKANDNSSTFAQENKTILPTEETTLQQSVEKYGYDPNAEVWKSIEETANKRGMKAVMDDTYFKNNTENSLYIKDDNGNRMIVFNPNANPDTIIQSKAIHELTHDLLSSDNSKNKLLDITPNQNIADSDIIKYVEKIEGYTEARQNLEQVYAKITDNNGNLVYNPNSAEFKQLIDEEVVAHVLEAKLGNQEFINRLNGQKPSLARRIYNWVMDKIDNLGKSSEYRQEKAYWRNVANRFEKAFNMDYNTTNAASTMYATENNNPYNRYSVASTEQQRNDVNLPTREQSESQNRLPDQTQERNNRELNSSFSYDSEGRKLSKEQQKFFKDSKVRDENGNLLVVYHTTGGENVPFSKAQFNTFNPVGSTGYRFGNQVVNFFTDSQEMSGSYVDQNYVPADTSKITNMDQVEGIIDYYNSSDLVEYSIKKNNGKYELYDVRNEEVVHTFDSQENLYRNITQIIQEVSGLDENVDADGYQYEGYLNITNPYIVDAKGNDWNRIDVDNILKMKQKIKDKWDIPENQLKELKGDTLKELNRDLTKLGYQLMNDEYGDLGIFTKSGILASNVINVNDVMQEIRVDLDSDLKTPISTNDVVFSVLAENELGKDYDGVIIKNVVDYGGASSNSDVPANVYIAFNSNQFKAVDNTTPTTDADIRYSKEVKEFNEFIDKNLKPTGTTGTLMAIHNLSEEKLKSILELGGFPVPSIAITNPSKINHEGYGNISVLFDKNTIDPLNNQNEVYSRDVWSPRFPTINREILKDNVSKVSKDIGISYSSLEYLAEDYNNVEDLAYRLSRDNDVVEKYLKDRNISYDNDTNIRKVAEENGIMEFLTSNLKNIYGKKGIRNDKEIYTPSGNRRSFNQLHDEYNLENLVKTLTKKKTVGGEESFASGTGVGTIEAKLSKKLNSIDDIKKYENEIENISYEEKQKFKDAIYDDMAELNEFRKYKSEYSFYDNSGYALNDFAEYKEQNLSNLKKALEKNEIDSTKIPESLLNKTIKDINALKNLPTDYFEAKPQRAVGLDEVEAIVIPNNTTEEFRKALNDAGLDFVEYDPNIEGDRQKVINKFDNLKFSKTAPGAWQDFVNKHFKSEGTKTTLKDTKLPTKEKTKLPTKEVTKKEVKQIAPVKETKQIAPVKEKTNIPMAKSEEVKQMKYSTTDYKKIADSINSKPRSWLETSLDSKTLEQYQPELIKGLKDEKLTYVVQSNKSTLDKANKKLSTMKYENAVAYIESKLYDEKNMDLTDIALTERLIQEASKKGDYQTASDLIQDLAIVGTDLGQKVQALSLIKKLTPEGQLSMYQKVVNRAKAKGEFAFEDVEITPEMVKTILDAYDKNGNYDQADLNERVEKFKEQVAEQLKSTTSDKLNAWRYLSMLGNPKTHIRNIVSNVAMKGTLKVKNAMARTLESIAPIKQENRTKTWKSASSEVKQFAKQTAIEMKDTITGENKYNEKTQIEQKKKIFNNKLLEKASNFNGAALEFEDWLFSRSAFESTFREYLTAQGIRTQQDIQNNPEIVEKGKQYAVEQAEIATFRQYSRLAADIAKIERKSKLGKLAIEALVPFKKTPINVAKAGLNYSPLGLAKNVFYDSVQLQKGNINGSQFIDNLSQGMTGTSLALLGYMLAKAGILSGAGEDDKEGKYDKQLGNQTYAINLGGNSYSISWLSPVAMPLLVGANSYESLERQEGWDPNIVVDSLASTLDPLSSMSFLSGLTDALNSYSKGSSNMIKDLSLNTAESYILQYVPTLLSQVASVTDDKKRSTTPSNNSKFKWGEKVGRQIMYKIPGLRQQLEVSTDIWGNDKEQSSNIAERAFETFLAPYSKTKHIATEVDDEIKNIYGETGNNGVLPGVPYGYIKYGDETYRMSAKEYTQYKKTYGQTANSYISELINTNSYQDASDDIKAKMIDKVYDYARAEANEKYFNNYDVDYTSNTLQELNDLKDIGISSKSFAEYLADKTQIASIRSSSNYTSEEKKDMALDIFTSSELNNKQLSYLYGKYYSTTEKLNALNSVNMPIKEFIKYDLKDFRSDYNSRGKLITGSKQRKVMNYVNSLNLSVPQKALLIKMEYNKFSGYDDKIEKLINSSNGDFLDKAYLVKQSGFSGYDKQIIKYVFNNYSTAKEREKVLKSLGFTVRNGRVY